MKKSMAFAAIILLSLSVVAQAETIKNWAAPSTWTPPAAQATGGRTAQVVTTYPPLPFIPVTPCRVADTRGNGFTGSYGPPSLGAGASRTFVITTQCGIPTSAVAVSFNFAVWNTLSFGDLKVYPAGGAIPTVSTINWNPGMLALANAAVVPLGSSGNITVVNESPNVVDLFFDVNGYYASTNTDASLGTFANFTPSWIGGWFTSTLSSGAAYGAVGYATGSTGGVGVLGTGGLYSVWGHATASGALGVYGDSALSNGVFGVSNAPATAGVLGENNTVNDGNHGVGGFAGGAAKVFGVQGQISSAATAGSAAVHGIGAATSATSYGVLGETTATASNSAGVQGVIGGTPNTASTTWIAAAVRGDSANDFGVFGVSNYKGVVGVEHNSSSGTLEAKGTVGYKPGSTAYAFYGETGDYGGTGAKYFVEPHATDPTKVIRYISLEGPESGTYFRGKGRTQAGVAVIEVPDHFRMVSAEEGMTVHITPVGHFAQTWVESADLNSVVIGSSRDVDFNYIVHGVRRAFRNFNPIDVSPEFKPETAQERLPDGLPAEIRVRLVKIGIYNPDGTVSMATAERLGWAQQWRDQAAAREKAAAEARAAEQGARAALQARPQPTLP